MNVVEREALLIEVDEPTGLWLVLIDLNCGYRKTDWQINSAPKPLAAALDESADLRRDGWITRLTPARKMRNSNG